MEEDSNNNTGKPEDKSQCDAGDKGAGADGKPKAEVEVFFAEEPPKPPAKGGDGGGSRSGGTKDARGVHEEYATEKPKLLPGTAGMRQRWIARKEARKRAITQKEKANKDDAPEDEKVESVAVDEDYASADLSTIEEGGRQRMPRSLVASNVDLPNDQPTDQRGDHNSNAMDEIGGADNANNDDDVTSSNRSLLSAFIRHTDRGNRGSAEESQPNVTPGPVAVRGMGHTGTTNVNNSAIATGDQDDPQEGGVPQIPSAWLVSSSRWTVDLQDRRMICLLATVATTLLVLGGLVAGIVFASTSSRNGSNSEESANVPMPATSPAPTSEIIPTTRPDPTPTVASQLTVSAPPSTPRPTPSSTSTAPTPSPTPEPTPPPTLDPTLDPTPPPTPPPPTPSPTLSPTPPPTLPKSCDFSDILFTDSFSSAELSSEWVEMEPRQWISGGWLHSKDPDTADPRDSGAIVHTSDKSWRDYSVSIVADFVTGTRWEDFSIIVRSDGYYRSSTGNTGSGYQVGFRNWEEPSNPAGIYLIRLRGADIQTLVHVPFQIPSRPVGIYISAIGPRNSGVARWQVSH